MLLICLFPVHWTLFCCFAVLFLFFALMVFHTFCCTFANQTQTVTMQKKGLYLPNVHGRVAAFSELRLSAQFDCLCFDPTMTTINPTPTEFRFVGEGVVSRLAVHNCIATKKKGIRWHWSRGISTRELLSFGGIYIVLFISLFLYLFIYIWAHTFCDLRGNTTQIIFHTKRYSRTSPYRKRINSQSV